ncbi:dermonecrotic toxin domain-containing protein [Pseudomonas sp. NPDC087639]|uniref:dermonecrotic toxin domain-containing protein n=1 Tax=Pseudomonas sp. NPDC087639 TaxID=3364445 RepID=UPI00381BE246
MHPTDEQHTATSHNVDSQQPDVHYLHLKASMPDWLGNASAARRNALKTTQPALPSRLRAVSVAHHQALKALNAAHWTAQNDVDQQLEHFQDASTFAEPLLKAALKEQFALDLDVRTTYLHLYIPATTPLFSIKTGARTWTVSLLDAALHNFEEKETEDDAYEADSTFITQPSATGQFDTLPAIKQTLSIAAFTRLCRTLDIGAQYKTWLEDHLGFGDEAKASALRLKVDKSQQAALKAALQLARMNDDISEGYFRTITALAEGVPHLRINGQSLLCNSLTMMEAPLTGIAVFAPPADEPQNVARVVAWVPDDPEHPIKEYASSAELEVELTRQLRSRDYQKFFSRFVNHEQRGFFFSSLNARLSRVTWHEPVPGSPQPVWRDEPFDKPDLQLAATPISGELWEHLYQGKLNKILNDAQVIAVATATVDSKVRWALWDSFVGIASTIVQTAAFIIAPFVPVLGEMMMAYMAYQFLDEMFEGIVEWTQGQNTEALTHLFGCLESLVQLGAFVAGGVVALGEFRNVLPKEIVAFIDSFKPVQMPNGKTLYWKPDLSAYQQKNLPTPGSSPSRLGLHEHQGKLLLPIDQGHYAVKETPIPGQYRIDHPTRPDAYKPLVRHNGDGAWHTEIEQPLEWDAPTALRRIGHSVESFSPVQRERVLQISGFDHNALRQMHVDQEPLPPLLADSIARFKIDQDLQLLIEQMGSELPEQQRSADPLTQLQLLNDYGRWPGNKRLRLMDQQQAVTWQSSADETLPLTDIRSDGLVDGDVLKTLLQTLDEQDAKALLGEDFAGPDLTLEVRTRHLRKQLLHHAKTQRGTLFEARYQALETPDDPLISRLTQHEPTLPRRITEELLNNATGDELLLISEGQLPQRQQNLIQIASEEVRVARAYEGLEMGSVSNPDTDTLVLHSLRQVPGWSGDVRLEIRDGAYEGKVLDSTGRVDAPVQKILVRQTDDLYQPFDDRGQELHSATDIYSSILYALPDTERQALNIRIGQPEQLKSAIRARPLAREDLRVAISLPPAPQPQLDTLRLVGRGGRQPTFGLPDAYVHPGAIIEPQPLDPVQVIYRGYTTQEAEDFATRFNQDPVAIRNELTRLRGELSQLQDDLRLWETRIPVNNPDTGLPLTVIELRAARQSRARLRVDIERCWRRELRSSTGYTLQIREPIIGDLPVLNADFSHVTLLSINGSARTGAVDGFLQQFPQLFYLDMQNLNVPNLPPAIRSMPRLRNLILRNCGIVLPADSRALFSPLSELLILDLQGNRLGAAPEVHTIPSLRYINLENTGITKLPDGLLDHPRLSNGRFDGNQITDIPTAFFDLPPALSDGFSFANNPLSPISRERVKAYYQQTGKHFGILPERADMNRAMNLFPALDTEQAAELLYQLPGTLVDGRVHLAGWEAEAHRMQNDLAQWTNNVPDHHPETGQALTISERVNERLARQRFSIKLEQFWHERSPVSPNSRSSRLVASVEFIGDMPVLDADFSHVAELTLDGNKNVSTVLPFLQRFQNLTDLELSFFDLEPATLESINARQLVTLRLKNCGVVITPENQAALCAMSQLEILELRGNPLGSFFDLNLLPSLKHLDLSDTGLSELPAGITDNHNLATALFSENNIVELPDALFDLPAERSDGIDLAENPRLSSNARNQIKNYYRKTGHDFDVLADPTDIALAKRLFPTLDTVEASEVIYDLPGTLADSRIQLNVWQMELSGLEQDLRTWAVEVPHQDPVTGAAIDAVEMFNNYTARSEFAQRLQDFWQSRSTTSSMRDDHFIANLAFTGDMPRLNVDFSHVSSLNLMGTASVNDIASFVELFPNLHVLEMRNFELGQIPANLGHLSQLKELMLTHCNITLTAEGQTLLQSLNELELLNLSHNTLVQIPDLAALPMLNDVRLTNTGIGNVPNGLSSHPNLRNALLNDNAITDLPESFFAVDIDLADGIDLANNPLSPSTRERIKSHYAAIGYDFGVLPDLADIAKAQALFPDLDIEDVTHVIYELPGTLADGSAQLAHWEAELTQMVSDLTEWSDRAPAGLAGLNMTAADRATQRFERRAFSVQLEHFWRSRQNSKTELRLNAFDAHLRVIGDLPALSADFSHVTQMTLQGSEKLTGVEGFLNCFTGLEALEMRRFALDQFPLAVSRMPQLKTLVLSSCGIAFDESGQAALSSLSRLTMLDMYNNPLGSAPDISALRALTFIDLSRTGIDHLPPSLLELPVLETAILHENLISELPEALFQLPADASNGFDLNRNPLLPATRERIKTHHQALGIDFGVSVPQEDSLLARALYPHLTDARLDEIVYGLPGTLADGHLELIRRQTEITTLINDLEAWTNEIPLAPGTNTPLTGDSLIEDQECRMRFKESLEQCWRRIVREGRSEFDFTFHLPITGELPTLSADFWHIRTLILAGNRFKLPRVGRFLERFPHLRSLTIESYHLGDIPGAIPAMESLTELSLVNCQITLTQESANALRGMSNLTRLALRDNALGRTPDLSQMTSLARLNLNNTGLTETPPGLFNRPDLVYADLANNAIVELPIEIIEADTTEFIFSGNLLSPSSQQALSVYASRRAVRLQIPQRIGRHFEEFEDDSFSSGAEARSYIDSSESSGDLVVD